MPSPELQMFAAAAALPQFFLLVLWSSSRGESAQILQVGRKGSKGLQRTGHFKNGPTNKHVGLSYSYFKLYSFWTCFPLDLNDAIYVIFMSCLIFLEVHVTHR